MEVLYSLSTVFLILFGAYCVMEGIDGVKAWWRGRRNK
jgi:hypothetical protein